MFYFEFRKILFTNLLVTVFGFFGQNVLNQITCEQILESGNGYDYKTCFMQDITSISTRGVEISTLRDDTNEGIEFSQNIKISFLPWKVVEKFPNLVAYSASGCSLKEIEKQNFEGLTKLKALNIPNNQIETIASDTFEGLIQLEILFLGIERTL